MDKFAVFILLLLPCFASGQLFPKLADFNGNIEKVIEKRYGQEVNDLKKDSGVFIPGKYSGWKYIYEFDKNSKLVKRTNTFQEQVKATYLYQSNTIGNIRIEREIINESNQNYDVEYIEYENFADSAGRIQKVNFWSFNAQKNMRELFLVEKNAEYENDRLTSFIRYNLNESGTPDTGEKCDLYYDSSGRLARIERHDISTNLKTILYYQYNERGLVNRFSIDYLVGLRNDQNKQKQDSYFKYDRRGNWVKRYYIIGKKKQVEARRKIIYN